MTEPTRKPRKPPGTRKSSDNADLTIYNRRRPDGTFPPLSEFFDSTVA